MKTLEIDDIILSRFKYDENSESCLMWVENKSKKTLNKAGWLNSQGYWTVKISGVYYLVHRIVWTLINGGIPDGLIVNHINCNRSDNRISNLELVTYRQNSRRSKLVKNKILSTINTSGINGIHEEKYWNSTKTKLNYTVRVTWRGVDYKINRKSFSYNKYGKDQAWKLAIEFRNQVVKTIDKQVDTAVFEKHNTRGNKECHLLVSKFQTPDGTILISKYTHDYVTHFDIIENSWFGVDGGTSYQKITGDVGKLNNLSVYTTDSHEVIRESFVWGSRGINGDEPVKYNLLKVLTDDHIRAILSTQTHLPEYILNVFRNELDYRTS